MALTTQAMSPQVVRAVQRAASGPTDGIVPRIAERLGGAASATDVYGAPVERDGVTVITVTRVR